MKERSKQKPAKLTSRRQREPLKVFVTCCKIYLWFQTDVYLPMQVNRRLRIDCRRFIFSSISQIHQFCRLIASSSVVAMRFEHFVSGWFAVDGDLSCQLRWLRKKKVGSRQSTCPLIAVRSNTWFADSTSSATGCLFGLSAQRCLFRWAFRVGPLFHVLFNVLLGLARFGGPRSINKIPVKKRKQKF